MAQEFSASDIVLVTGGNGYVAESLIDQLLSMPSGPVVRATVRRDDAGTYLAKGFHSAVLSHRLQVVRVDDITADGAFDEAIKDVTYVAHVASPVNYVVKDVVKDLLEPAIKGTTGILKAALTEPKIKAVVVTGSISAVPDLLKNWNPGYTYTAADWFPITYDEIADPNFDATPYPPQWQMLPPYMASKTLSEKAAWELHAKHRPSWSLTFLLPVGIGGPRALPMVRGADELHLSAKPIWQNANGSELGISPQPFWVDARDVAKAHIQALTRPEAWGKRHILSVGEMLSCEMADIVRKNFPSLHPPEQRDSLPEHFSFDGGTALRGLGMGEYISLEKMVVDTVRQVMEAEGMNGHANLN